MNVPHTVSCFDGEQFNFVEKLRRLYDVTNLQQLHLNVPKSKECESYYAVAPIFGRNDRKSPFVTAFIKSWDSDESWKTMYESFLTTNIAPTHYPNESSLIYQTTPNIRIHVPGCTNIGRRDSDPSDDVIGLHSDSEFNHPSQETNFIVALTDMYETNSIYFEPEPDSGLPPDGYTALTLKACSSCSLYLNKCKHFNRLNQTGNTRVSFDFRVIPGSKFNPSDLKSATSNTKFSVGQYYSELKM